MDSHLYAKKCGGMEEELFVAVVLLYKSLYPNLHPTFEWEGKKIVKWPIFIDRQRSGTAKKEQEKHKVPR